jgi:uncharacterized OsmC-like protein
VSSMKELAWRGLPRGAKFGDRDGQRGAACLPSTAGWRNGPPAASARLRWKVNTAMSASSSALNGVNLKAVGDLIGHIRQKPEAARTEWKSLVRWQGGFKSEARSRDLPPVPSDEPSALGGDNSAVNPVEQLLGALGNCLAVGYAANASVAGIRIDRLELELEGNIDLHKFLGLSGDNAGFDAIRVKVRLDSDATPAALAALHAHVVNTSPVGHTLTRALPLHIDLL